MGRDPITLKALRRSQNAFRRHFPWWIILCMISLLMALVMFMYGNSFSSSSVSWNADSLPRPHHFAQSSENDNTDFALALKESGGFFDDFKEADWRRLKDRIEKTPDCLRDCGPEEPHLWYQNNWEPNFTCLHERRLGVWGDGGKWVCDPHRITASAAKRGCLVYSVGSNNDFSFEEAVLRDISAECEIHTFDHTIGQAPSNLPTGGTVIFHPWGLAGSSQGPNMKTMATIVRELGHEDREIDIFKIDCEGCEWETVKSWFKSGARIRQVLVEVHAGTTDVVPSPAMEFMSFMKQQGYVIFHKEPNIAWSGGDCIEYAFVLLVEGLVQHRRNNN